MVCRVCVVCRMCVVWTMGVWALTAVNSSILVLGEREGEVGVADLRTHASVCFNFLTSSSSLSLSAYRTEGEACLKYAKDIQCSLV